MKNKLKEIDKEDVIMYLSLIVIVFFVISMLYDILYMIGWVSLESPFLFIFGLVGWGITLGACLVIEG